MTHHTDDQLPPEFSEEALALRFAEKHGMTLRYVAAWGRWMLWDGKCWQQDNTLQVLNFARMICRQAAASCNKDNHAKRIASAQTVSAIERLAKTDRRIAATVEQWDTNPWLLNTPKGVVDLRTGVMRLHQAEDYITQITSVAPDGDCPVWVEFLLKVTNGNKELIRYLQRKTGYCLTGSTKEQDIDFCYGTGGNGKGVFINTITGIIQDYACIASVETFTASSMDKHPTDLAMLRGKRLVTAQETEEGRRWAESRIKAMTGGDPITARFMRQDFFTYIPQFKLIIAGNHKPSLRNVDEAIRRRFHIVPFTVTIPAHERDKDLTEKLKTEWPGILKWAIEGAKEWYRDGLKPPLIITDATAEYLADEDMLEIWLDECCVMGKAHTSTMTDLYANWQQWCQNAGEEYGSMKRFGQNLRSKHTELTNWQCHATRRQGLKGIQAIKQMQQHYSDHD